MPGYPGWIDCTLDENRAVIGDVWDAKEHPGGYRYHPVNRLHRQDVDPEYLIPPNSELAGLIQEMFEAHQRWGELQRMVAHRLAEIDERIAKPQRFNTNGSNVAGVNLLSDLDSE